ncbi:MAG: hypothetical protein EKK29_13825 [Hyphomicrobiales bacterium]|nr:MAG: hypothetical protein EKK29_13825 [Hyphomicrobiales bacterium]
MSNPDHARLQAHRLARVLIRAGDERIAAEAILALANGTQLETVARDFGRVFSGVGLITYRKLAVAMTQGGRA